MDRSHQRLAEQVEALSQICETLVIRLLEAEEQLELLSALMNEGTITGLKDGLSCQASDQALSEAAATIQRLGLYLDAKTSAVGQPLESFAQPNHSDPQRIQASHAEPLLDDSDFIDDVNQELNANYEESLDDRQDFLAA
ncbi:hypothetical protein KQ302_11350 [Synechococcus sp. CS-602]|uniref:hypothetical protein n=1 Tax=Synechococcaceae TaxID=1890426 RepID=UPI0011A7F48B|nr:MULTISPECIES: hypothetical protein [Synechococcaceae]MCT0205685.1 hypothetical protein [Synechococcus sp. CS-602]MCT4367230.1 hypothetical protein [Candidatus Regnicoccus frigidus MAG-AL2]